MTTQQEIELPPSLRHIRFRGAPPQRWYGDPLRRRGQGYDPGDRLRGRGVDHLLISNIDNLGASLDLAVLEAVDAGFQASVEVVARAEVRGRPVIIEGMRLPAGCDPDTFEFFNTNTIWVTTGALEAPLALSWIPVRRELMWPDGGLIEAIQFEQLIGQLTEFMRSAYLVVDRAQRFLPIKTRAELKAARERIEDLVRRTGLWV